MDRSWTGGIPLSILTACMESLPYFLGLAVACTVLSLGLQRRAVWMWYLGWVFLYLCSGYLGAIFLSELHYAEDPASIGRAFLLLFGGLFLWLPASVWWATHRHLFGARPTRPAKQGPDQATPKPTSGQRED